MLRRAGSLMCLIAVVGVAHASEESLTFRRGTDGRYLAVIDGISDGPGCVPEYLPPESVDVVGDAITAISPEDATGCFLPLAPRPYEVVADLGLLFEAHYDVTWTQPQMPDLAGVLATGAVGNLVPNPEFDDGLDGWSAQDGDAAFELDASTGLPEAPSLHLTAGSVESACFAVDASAPFDLRILVDQRQGVARATIEPFAGPDCTQPLDTISMDSLELTGFWQSMSRTNLSLPTGTIAVRIALGATPDGFGTPPDVRFDHVEFGASGSVPNGIPFQQEGLSGAWYDPSASGQGFEFSIEPSSAVGGLPLFGAWYTYDLAGVSTEQRWYSLQTTTAIPDAPASFTIYRNLGGNFAAPPATNAEPVGTGTLAFYSCTSGLLSYAFDSGLAGSVPLHRLMPNVECDANVPPPAPPASDFGYSGVWYDVDTSGQGFMIEINPDNAQAFVGWYTYALSGVSDPEHGQRWFSAQGAYTVGTTTMALDFYASTGGTFAAPGGVTTEHVGSATLTYVDCYHATLDYAFTAGEMSGQAGTIALVRLGVALSSCPASN